MKGRSINRNATDGDSHLLSPTASGTRNLVSCLSITIFICIISFRRQAILLEFPHSSILLGRNWQYIRASNRFTAHTVWGGSSEKLSSASSNMGKTTNKYRRYRRGQNGYFSQLGWSSSDEVSVKEGTQGIARPLFLCLARYA